MTLPSTRRPSLLPLSALGLALCLGLTPLGCKSKTDEGADSSADSDEAVDSAKAADSAKAGGDDSAPAGEGGAQEAVDEGGAAPVAPATVTRADSAASTTGKGAKSLGFQVNELTHLFALDATTSVPDWGTPALPASGAELSRDDDLDTAWTCEQGKADTPCVLGLSLPKKAKVEVVRLYAAAGPRYRDYTGHPRVAKVRVHTDAGYVDASLADGANHTYVRFDAPIETQTLAIEILDVHPGKKDALVHVAEVEVYGTEGSPRAPLEFNPELAWTGWETGAWSGAGDYTIRQVFVRYAVPGAPVGPEGPVTKRLSRATAVFGKDGDNYMLFERMHGTDCTEHKGSYILYDRRNRMLYPLGELGGSGAKVYRHQKGDGFAVGWIEDGRFTVKGIVEEAGKLVWKRPPKTAPDSAAAQLSKWGFEAKPLGRGNTLSSPPTSCHRAGTGQLEPLQAATTISSDADLDPASWLVCELAGSILYTQGTCGSGALAYLVNGDELVGEFEGKADEDRGFRLRRAGNSMLLELSTKGGESASLYWADADKFVQLDKQGGLTVRPPKDCTACSDVWLDADAAAEPLAEDGGGGDMGEPADADDGAGDGDGDADASDTGGA